jgi:hypothetical protein
VQLSFPDGSERSILSIRQVIDLGSFEHTLATMAAEVLIVVVLQDHAVCTIVLLWSQVDVEFPGMDEYSPRRNRIDFRC